MLYGNGVTRNFLTILEAERDRSRRRIIRLGVLTIFVLALALLFFQRFLWEGMASVGAFLLAGAALGAAWAHFVNVRRYNASIRSHWNRWMRFSVSCVTVGECYRKVHNRSAGLGILWLASLLAALILAHLVLLAMAINETAGFVEILVFFAVDAALLGFFLAKRFMEGLWYRQFLRGVSDLLHEGEIGVWGVY